MVPSGNEDEPLDGSDEENQPADVSFVGLREIELAAPAKYADYLGARPGAGKGLVYEVAAVARGGARLAAPDAVRCAEASRLAACPFASLLRDGSPFALWACEGDLLVFLEFGDKAPLWSDGPQDASMLAGVKVGSRLVTTSVATARAWAATAAPPGDASVVLCCGGADASGGDALHAAFRRLGVRSTYGARWLRGVAEGPDAAARFAAAAAVAAALAPDDGAAARASAARTYVCDGACAALAGDLARSLPRVALAFCYRNLEPFLESRRDGDRPWGSEAPGDRVATLATSPALAAALRRGDPPLATFSSRGLAEDAAAWLDDARDWSELCQARSRAAVDDAVSRAPALRYDDLLGAARDAGDGGEGDVLVGDTRHDVLAAALRHLLRCFRCDEYGAVDVAADGNRAVLERAAAALRDTRRRDAARAGATAPPRPTSPLHGAAARGFDDAPAPGLADGDRAVARACVEAAKAVLGVPLTLVDGGCLFPNTVGIKGRPAPDAPALDRPPTLPAAARSGGLCSWLSAKLRQWF